MGFLTHIVLLGSCALIGSLSRPADISSGVFPRNADDLLPANSLTDHEIDIKLTTRVSTASSNLQDEQNTKGADIQQNSDLLKALTENGMKQDSKDPRSPKMDTAIESALKSVSTSAASSLDPWIKLSQDLTRAQLIDLVLADLDEIEKVTSRQKRAAGLVLVSDTAEKSLQHNDDDGHGEKDDDDDADEKDDDDNEKDGDDGSRRLGREGRRRASSRLATPSPSVAGSTRVRGLFHRTRPMRTSHTTTHAQRRTTLAGSARTARSTASYAGRCPRVSELSIIRSQMSRYSKAEITNLIRCVNNLKNQFCTTTTTTAAPRRSRAGGVLDADSARARDLMMLG